MDWYRYTSHSENHCTEFEKIEQMLIIVLPNMLLTTRLEQKVNYQSFLIFQTKINSKLIFKKSKKNVV